MVPMDATVASTAASRTFPGRAGGAQDRSDLRVGRGAAVGLFDGFNARQYVVAKLGDDVVTRGLRQRPGDGREVTVGHAHSGSFPEIAPIEALMPRHSPTSRSSTGAAASVRR